MKPAKHKYTVLHQICNIIPAFLVSKLAKKYGIDKQARSCAGCGGEQSQTGLAVSI